MSQQIDSTTAFNCHDSLSVPYQHGCTSSITTGNLIGRRVDLERDNSGLVIWTWKLLRGRGEDYLRIVNFYRSATPRAGGGPGSVYAQHMTHFSNLRRRECPITDFLSYIADDIKTWKKRYQIIWMRDINTYIISKKTRSFTDKLGLRELITDIHG